MQTEDLRYSYQKQKICLKQFELGCRENLNKNVKTLTGKYNKYPY